MSDGVGAERAEAVTALVVLARAPQHGMVKTRLAAAISADAAMDVYRQLLATTARVADEWRGPRLLLLDGDAAMLGDTGLADLPRRSQPHGPLGERIAAALCRGLELAPRCIAIGSDCPALSRAALREVLARLDEAPVAFGPADDGGFWAIAAGDVRVAEVVGAAAVPWSTSATLQSLRAALDAAGLSSALGPRLADCDGPADLQRAIAAGLLRPPVATAGPARRDGYLFLCVANSARSQLAEAIARTMLPAGAIVASAGSAPTRVNPLAIEVLREAGIDTTALRSKGIAEVDLGRIGTVVTLCAEEYCLLPDVPARLHWPIDDPAGASGTQPAQLAAFRRARDEIRMRLEAHLRGVATSDAPVANA